MESDIYLFIEARYGNIAIPFINLKKIDNFTIGFENEGELIKFLINALEINLLVDDVYNVYISYDYKRPKSNGVENVKLPVKYKNDNYNEDDLRFVFADYLKKDPKRIKSCGIRHVLYDPIIGYVKHNEPISYEEIDFAVKLYFRNGYSSKRKIYFLLKYDGYKVKINKINKKSEDKELASFKTDDEYFQSLINYGSLGIEERAKVMDEISGYNLSDIDRNIRNAYYGLFDGATREDMVDLEDVYYLTYSTGLNIEQLKNITNNYGSKKRR